MERQKAGKSVVMKAHPKVGHLVMMTAGSTVAKLAALMVEKKALM